MPKKKKVDYMKLVQVCPESQGNGEHKGSTWLG